MTKDFKIGALNSKNYVALVIKIILPTFNDTNDHTNIVLRQSGFYIYLELKSTTKFALVKVNVAISIFMESKTNN